MPSLPRQLPAWPSAKRIAPACLILFAACAGGSDGFASGQTSTPLPTSTPSPSTAPTRAQSCTGKTPSASQPGPPPQNAALTVANGLTIQTIAHVSSARELAALPNGDLIVGTLGSSIYIVPNAEGSGAAGAPQVFATVNDSPANGVTFVPALCTIYVGTQHAILRIPYADGQLTAASVDKIASIRQGPIAPNSDGDEHSTTSVAFANGMLYASVGSSCNACTEVDVTRASIQVMNPDGTAIATRATRIRNAIALATNPTSGHLWVGGAGQDNLPQLHPFEFMDDLSSHAPVTDYGWPDCEENHIAYVAGANCSATVAPLVAFPAYITHIGATFYPPNQAGTFALGSAYRGALFVSSHGSWHALNSCTVAPEVDYVPMKGDVPARAVNWKDPSVQWKPFVTGFQPACGSRIGRPTGIAVGSQGSIFIADDANGTIYRVRPFAVVRPRD
ncbi:MAG: hypothetical protein ABI282_11655 [Candidatus Baltobacteraceae bacterium]